MVTRDVLGSMVVGAALLLMGCGSEEQPPAEDEGLVVETNGEGEGAPGAQPSDGGASTDELLAAGRSDFRTGDYEQAAEAAAKAIERDPQSARAHRLHGNALVVLGRIEEAMEHFDRAIELDPQYAEAYRSRAYAQAGRDDLLSALSDLDEALALEPDYAMALADRAHVLAWMGRYEQALEDYRRFLDVAPDHALAGAVRQRVDEIEQRVGG